MTNKEKFREVFGDNPDTTECPFEFPHDCSKCEANKTIWDCQEIFWNAEYKESKESKE